jgi:hypothetical protein
MFSATRENGSVRNVKKRAIADVVISLLLTRKARNLLPNVELRLLTVEARIWASQIMCLIKREEDDENQISLIMAPYLESAR